MQQAPSLTRQQTESAMSELNQTIDRSLYPKVDRALNDPPINGQTYGLISFIPAKDAVPNKHGVYGYAKLRGNFNTEVEANNRAEYLIKEVDSAHKIYHTWVGRPFPMTTNSNFSAEVKKIQADQELKINLDEAKKEAKLEDRKQMQEIHDRERALREDVKKDERDPYEVYIESRVKNAQLMWTYLEHQKKMLDIKQSIIKTRTLIAEMDEEHIDFKDTFMQKYMESRKEAGFKDQDQEQLRNSFMAYLVEDAELDF